LRPNVSRCVAVLVALALVFATGHSALASALDCSALRDTVAPDDGSSHPESGDGDEAPVPQEMPETDDDDWKFHAWTRCSLHEQSAHGERFHSGEVGPENAHLDELERPPRA
jgi:hypothetical protein